MYNQSRSHWDIPIRLSPHPGGRGGSGMTGAERALLYRLTVETGLRVNELRSLTPGSFDFENDTPIVRVAAAYSKRRQNNTLPLRCELAAMLMTHFANKLPMAAAFNVPPSYDTADMNIPKTSRKTGILQ